MKKTVLLSATLYAWTLKKPNEFWLAVNIFIYQLEQIIYHTSPVILFVCAIIIVVVIVIDSAILTFRIILKPYLYTFFILIASDIS